MSKITILTHRLGHNYGGILQAFALQGYIRAINRSNNVATTHRQPYASFVSRVRTSLSKTLRTKKIYLSNRYIEKSISQHTDQFIKSYLKSDEYEKLLPDTDVLVVGSDQVWRAAYINPLLYLFEGVNRNDMKRISYAASFGNDDLSEYTAYQVSESSKLAKKFDGISVREDSGRDIVSDNWGLESERHIDPTLLLKSEDYRLLIDSTDTNELNGSMFVYVLDRSKKNTIIIDKVESLSTTSRFEILPKEYVSYVDFLKNRHDYVMPKVEQWLRSFRDAEYIVTDSFHGTVFSIIFNKPFISVGNEGRGLARFVSLLSMFGLQHRLVTSPEQITKELVKEKIDWALVNRKVKKEQKRSEEYLRKYIQ